MLGAAKNMSGYPPPDSHDLDGHALRRAFDGLSRQLAARDIKTHIYVVGGAAMVLAHRYARVRRWVAKECRSECRQGARQPGLLLLIPAARSVA